MAAPVRAWLRPLEAACRDACRDDDDRPVSTWAGDDTRIGGGGTVLKFAARCPILLMGGVIHPPCVPALHSFRFPPFFAAFLQASRFETQIALRDAARQAREQRAERALVVQVQVRA